MNLTHTLLNNPGLIALTVEAEQKEFAILPTAACIAAQARGHKIVFAHFQSDFCGGRIPFWHVVDPKHPSCGSTLSLDGLREWKVIKGGKL